MVTLYVFDASFILNFRFLYFDFLMRFYNTYFLLPCQKSFFPSQTSLEVTALNIFTSDKKTLRIEASRHLICFQQSLDIIHSTICSTFEKSQAERAVLHQQHKMFLEGHSSHSAASMRVIQVVSTLRIDCSQVHPHKPRISTTITRHYPRHHLQHI